MKKSEQKIHIAIIRQTLVLATGGFSLVSALAWNDLIKNFIETFVKPYVSEGSGVVAQLIYALAITTVAVIVTMQLGRILHSLEEKEQ